MGRVLITGSGMVAGGLESAVKGRQHEVQILSHDKCDVQDVNRLLDATSAFKPEIILHTAAVTRVNYCEENPRLAFNINVGGTENAVMAAQSVNAQLVVFSTDYVFDGSKLDGWLESDLPNPLNIYGETKLRAEEAALGYDRGFVVRTSGIFGKRADYLPERNFFKAIKGQVTSSEAKVPVVSDQFTAVTYAPFLGEMLLDLYESGLPRITHLVCSGSDSWAGWASTATGILQLPPDRIEPVPSKTQNTGTPRPEHSVLKSNRRLVSDLIDSYKAMDGLELYLAKD